MSYASQQLFESLENRSLLSAAPVGIDGLGINDLETPEATEVPLRHNEGFVSQAIRRQVVPTKNNWLVATWRGSIKVDMIFTTLKVKFSMKVNSATNKSITGTINVDGYQFKGTLPFKAYGTNQFAMSYSHGDYSGSIKGTVDPAAGKISGKISGEADGVPFSGKLSMSK